MLWQFHYVPHIENVFHYVSGYDVFNMDNALKLSFIIFHAMAVSLCFMHWQFHYVSCFGCFIMFHAFAVSLCFML